MEHSTISFRLTPGILADELQDHLNTIRFFPGENRQTLEDIRFYMESSGTDERYLYLMEEEQLNKMKNFPEEGAFLILGEVPPAMEFGRASVIIVPEFQGKESEDGTVKNRRSRKTGSDAVRLFNLCQELIQRHKEWASSLQTSVLHRGTIDDLCLISYEYFGNPMFVHDPQLYVLSCPIWKEGMVKWEKDELTGTIATPADLLNEFRLDAEYQDTLSTDTAQFFSADLRGHRDLYVNIWNEYGGYLGRLVIVELEKPIRESQKLAAEYLAGMIRNLLLGYGSGQEVYGRAVDLLLGKALKGEGCSEEELEDRVHMLGWHVSDSYICLTLHSESNTDGRFSNISICNYLESALHGSHAFLVDGRICMLINRQVNPDYHSVMIEVLRDHLYMAGISNEFFSLMHVAAYYRQAQIALDSCLNRKETKWYTRFSEVAAEYMLGLARKEMRPEYLCDPVLPLLEKYDKENGTELLKTLRMYVLSERNTVQASKALYIGRSTLFYRLRTIADLTGLDGEMMAEPSRNLYLRMSFSLWEQIE